MYGEAVIRIIAPNPLPIPLFLMGVLRFIYAFLIYAHFLRNTVRV
jgi:hypothetical protein